MDGYLKDREGGMSTRNLKQAEADLTIANIGSD
jgi:hypothetical protein